MSAAPAEIPVVAEIALALRRNLLPAIAVGSLAGLLVASYYLLPSTRAWWQAVGEAKVAGGLAFSFLAGAASTAWLPLGLRWLMGQAPSWREAAALTLFWGYRGAEVDLFYRLQGHLFGDRQDLATVATKVAVDQFLYSAWWAVPMVFLGLRFIERGCAWAPFRDGLTWRSAAHAYRTTLAATWMVWIPATSMVYSLPDALQFPLFALVACFFGVLMLTLVERR